MTAPLTHPTPAPQQSLEQRRDALLAQDHTLAQARKGMALDAWRLRLAWGLLYPRSSTRQFVIWLGQGEYQGRWYSYLAAGLAKERGLDNPALSFGELAARGERLQAGETPEQVRTQPAPLSGETSIRVSRETATALDQTFAELSESDTHLTRQDALETAVGAFAHAPALIRRALVHARETGENPLDALVKAVDERRNWRGWLAQQPCMACGVRPVELHHVRVGADDRSRTNEVLAPVCTRHHIARAGDSADAAHSGQAAWIERHFGSAETFWVKLALLYVRYAQESEKA